MLESIDTIKAQLWQKMRTKEYRDNFVTAHLVTSIAAQIQTLREDRGWTQRQLGERAGMTQARISLMESPGYDGYTFSTLRRLASALDVALIARFGPFSELVSWTADLSPQKLAVRSFDEDAISVAPAEELRPATRITAAAQDASIAAIVQVQTGFQLGSIGGHGQPYLSAHNYQPTSSILPSIPAQRPATERLFALT